MQPGAQLVAPSPRLSHARGQGFPDGTQRGEGGCRRQGNRCCRWRRRDSTSVDISFNAIGPGPATDRMPLTELSGDAFARPIVFYTSSNFITATAAGSFAD